MYFTIITNKKVADQIKKLCEMEHKMGADRSYVLGDIRHETGHSSVQIKAKYEKPIKPEDIFWLGYFSASCD